MAMMKTIDEANCQARQKAIRAEVGRMASSDLSKIEICKSRTQGWSLQAIWWELMSLKNKSLTGRWRSWRKLMCSELVPSSS